MTKPRVTTVLEAGRIVDELTREFCEYADAYWDLLRVELTESETIDNIPLMRFDEGLGGLLDGSVTARDYWRLVRWMKERAWTSNVLIEDGQRALAFKVAWPTVRMRLIAVYWRR
jgi:hypothetical protein